jgi:hypothetical protein
MSLPVARKKDSKSSLSFAHVHAMLLSPAFKAANQSFSRPTSVLAVGYECNTGTYFPSIFVFNNVRMECGFTNDLAGLKVRRTRQNHRLTECHDCDLHARPHRNTKVLSELGSFDKTDAAAAVPGLVIRVISYGLALSLLRQAGGVKVVIDRFVGVVVSKMVLFARLMWVD